MTLEAQTEDLRAENARLKTQLRVMEKKNPKLPVRRKLGWSFGQADFFNFLPYLTLPWRDMTLTIHYQPKGLGSESIEPQNADLLV